jgi:uncharacterized protein YacL
MKEEMKIPAIEEIEYIRELYILQKANSERRAVIQVIMVALLSIMCFFTYRISVKQQELFKHITNVNMFSGSTDDKTTTSESILPPAAIPVSN